MREITYRDALKEALTTKEKGPKVLVAQSECMLNRQRREKPLSRKAAASPAAAVALGEPPCARCLPPLP